MKHMWFVKTLAVVLIVFVLAGFGVTGCATTSSPSSDKSVSATSAESSGCPDAEEEIPTWLIDCPDGT